MRAKGLKRTDGPNWVLLLFSPPPKDSKNLIRRLDLPSRCNPRNPADTRSTRGMTC